MLEDACSRAYRPRMQDHVPVCRSGDTGWEGSAYIRIPRAFHKKVLKSVHVHFSETTLRTFRTPQKSPINLQAFLQHTLALAVRHAATDELHPDLPQESSCGIGSYTHPKQRTRPGLRRMEWSWANGPELTDAKAFCMYRSILSTH